jgi:hypothetical protein
MGLAGTRDDEDRRANEQRGPDSTLFDDIPPQIWRAFLIAWALLFGLFLVAFARDGRATIAIVTSCFFVMMILGLPAALAMHAQHGPHPWPRTIVTRNGPIPTGAAAAQILLIPVGAVIGLVAFIILAL